MAGEEPVLPALRRENTSTRLGDANLFVNGQGNCLPMGVDGGFPTGLEQIL
jgi:hypothetical protein